MSSGRAGKLSPRRHGDHGVFLTILSVISAPVLIFLFDIEITNDLEFFSQGSPP
jgi:hypothetical protein